jgi:geranylgeranyl pyrophosphate synthase
MLNLKKEIPNRTILEYWISMNSESKVKETRDIIEKRGKGAIKKAREELSSSKYNDGIVASALKYFTDVTLQGVLPVFPALMSLSCEAVGGKAEKTTTIGAALTLIAGAADIHDDIIDQSTVKYFKKTVFGKFGNDIALLAGDTLLIQGSMLLYRECESLPKKRKEQILNLLLEALFEISNAEAKETCLRSKLDTTPQEYLNLIKLKAVVPEVHCKIGGILGNANGEAITALGHYGRTFGIASGIREEFIDLLEHPELQNRIKNEWLPLPMLYALQNSKIRSKIKPLIENSNLAKKDADRIIKTILSSEEVQALKKDMHSMIRVEMKRISGYIQRDVIRKELTLLLQAITEGL